MPKRITYWTGTWDPGCEAHSRQVEDLRRDFGEDSRVISFSSGQKSFYDRQNRVVGFSNSHWPLLRAVSPYLERWGTISHIFGGLDGWHLLKLTGRRPVILTVTLDGPPLESDMYDKVRVFVAEDTSLASRLRQIGIEAERIRVIPPGVDVDRFDGSRAAEPMRPFRLLFASSPANLGEWDSRGVPLMIDLARRRPDVTIRCLWRPWGDAQETDRRLRELELPGNFHVVRGKVKRMDLEYQAAHATIVAFRPGFGKSTPNSILEGFGCGRPAILGPESALAESVTRTGAGVVAREHTVDALEEALDSVREGYHERCAAARALAEDQFSLRAYISAYSKIYGELS